MKIALHAEHVSMSVLLKLSLKATSTRSMLIFAPIAVLVRMFARLRLFILQNNAILKT